MFDEIAGVISVGWFLSSQVEIISKSSWRLASANVSWRIPVSSWYILLGNFSFLKKSRAKLAGQTTSSDPWVNRKGR